MKTTIGGDRLGAGNKQEVSMRNYSRSTHDLSYIWRSSMASGTLVPFMSELALPGDSFDIDLNCDVKTLPTVGPLFGSYKVQLDVFECPIRLYNGKLHMNMLNIGMDMKEITLPQMEMLAKYDKTNLTDNSQVNPSSIYSYLNMRGLGRSVVGQPTNIKRQFNAVPYLSYWDIYKNYYANKQEEEGVVIHQSDWSNEFRMDAAIIYENGVSQGDIAVDAPINPGTAQNIDFSNIVNITFTLRWDNPGLITGEVDTSQLTLTVGYGTQGAQTFQCDNVFGAPTITYYNTQGQMIYALVEYGAFSGSLTGTYNTANENAYIDNTIAPGQGEPQLVRFPLRNIDTMREDILKAVSDPTAFLIDYTSQSPYGLGLDTVNGAATEDYENTYCRGAQEGLGIKTYQSDLLNNWISTEWIDGPNGVNAVTAVDTSSGEFYIDSLNLANKVYTMLNRIAISGGSYDDWLNAVYTHERAKSVESPVYHGSLIKELAFEEVISNADVEVGEGEKQPLGTLAGRGRLTGKHKGGRMRIKCHEPSYIMGIVSITPRIDYSQGNKWDTNLKTMDDFHKPALDAIGYQSLITDQALWADTVCEDDGQGNWSIATQSAGKQPAWINYMTNINQCRGNFAEEGKEMFMTLNRRYKQEETGIDDLTTYIDPSLFNNIFAQEDLSSQNFWVQIGNRITARRKMSAKVIPNL